MRTHPAVRLILVLFTGISLGWAAPVLAKTNFKAVEKACSPGRDPQAPGNDSYSGHLWTSGEPLTPQKIPGAVTVSPSEAKCLIDRLGQGLVVIAAMRTNKKIPGTHEIPGASSGSSNTEIQETFALQLNALANGDKHKPILIYCHHVRCPLSYNATLRAVSAGYTKVFWLREGNSGWSNAGYAYEGAPPVAQGLTPAYLDEIKACDELYFDRTADKFAFQAKQIPDDADLNASFQKDRRKAQESRSSCLSNIKNRIAGNKVAFDDVNKRLARSDAEVNQQYQSTRAAVESNPTEFYAEYLDSYDISKLNDIVHRARSIKTLHEICGSFDTSLPSTQSALESARYRHKTYLGCLERVRTDDSDSIDNIEFQIAAETVAATARYTCSRRKIPNCLSDSTWRRVADVASKYNNDLVQTASDRRSSRQYTDIKAAIAKLNDWVDRLNAHVAQLNRDIDARNNSRQSYGSQPSYSSQPSYGNQPYDSGRYGTGRRDSSISAPGMR